jgi:serine/threonine protein kinase
MVAEDDHPSDMTLRSYGLSTLDDSTTQSVTQHLKCCTDCLRRAVRMSSGGDSGRESIAIGQPGSTGPVVSSLDGLSMLETSAHVKAPPPTNALPSGLAGHPDYEVVRELGQGGMGTVYLARNRLMERLEVLKIVSRHMINRSGALDRFLIEIRNAARLHHTNIVTAYSATRVGESLVFAMEYVEGLDLSRLVKAKGPLPVSNACNYVHQAALGLEHASELGMVHRDIKPSNLMLAKQGRHAVIKVLDFGLAKVRSEGAVDGGLTHEGQLLGTPDFIAPEQIRDARRADIRADIYSLGCTLYYLLTGRAPFHADNLYDILQAHHSMDAMPLNLARPEVPVELAALVAKMMAKEPNRRFQLPREIAQALTPFFKTGKTAFKVAEADVSRASSGRPVYGGPSARSDSFTEGAGSCALEKQVADRSTIATESIPCAEPRDTARAQNELPVRPPTKRRSWLWPSVAAAAMLVSYLVAWPSDVRTKTARGFIELVNLPKVARVYVDGEEASVTWPAGNKYAVISVKPGPHKVVVKKDGLEISGNGLSVQVEEEKAFAVRLPNPAASSKVIDGSDDPIALSEDEGEMIEDDPPAVRSPVAEKSAPPPGPVERAASVPQVTHHAAPAERTVNQDKTILSPGIRLVYVDEFDNDRRGLPRDLAVPHEPKHGRSDGVYYVYAGGGQQNWNVRRVDSEGTCEVVARVLSQNHEQNAAWALRLFNRVGQESRGLLIKITVKGELFLEPLPSKQAAAFRRIDPRIGPIKHPAIKPGHEFNTLLLTIRNREVAICVNGVQVCGPVRFEYNLTPATLNLGVLGPGKKRAEFDRVEIREMVEAAKKP